MKKLLRNSLVSSLFYLSIFGCGRESNEKDLPKMHANSFFLSYNEHINYVGLDSVYIENPTDPFVRIVGSKVKVNNLQVDFNELCIFQCQGCKYLILSQKGGNLISAFSLDVQNQILDAIAQDAINVKLPFSLEIELITDDLRTIKLLPDKTPKINFKRINLEI